MIERARTLVRYQQQLRVALIALGAAGLVLLVNYQMSAWACAGVSEKVADGMDVRAALQDLQSDLFQRFLFSLAFSIPVAAAVGILYSFRFAGPIYRFEKYFKELAAGRWDSRCSLRKGDDLQDLCVSLNEALDQLRGFLAQNRELIARVDALLEEGVLTTSGEGSEEVKKLRAQIAALNSVYRSRLPGQGEAPRSPPGLSNFHLESLDMAEALCAPPSHA